MRNYTKVFADYARNLIGSVGIASASLLPLSGCQTQQHIPEAYRKQYQSELSTLPEKYQREIEIELERLGNKEMRKSPKEIMRMSPLDLLNGIKRTEPNESGMGRSVLEYAVDQGCIFITRSEYNVIRQVDNDAADGKVDRRETNSNGRLIREGREVDIHADGKVDRRYTKAYEYNSNGKVIKQVREFDNNVDGKVDKRETSEYDSDGNVIRGVRENDYDDADGKVDKRETEAYEVDINSDGKVIRWVREFDDDADGKVDRREPATYEDDIFGRLGWWKK